MVSAFKGLWEEVMHCCSGHTTLSTPYPKPGQHCMTLSIVSMDISD